VAEEVQEGIFREIDEELRQEHYAKLWQRYGKAVIAAGVLLVGGVAGYQGWRTWDINMRTADGDRFAAAQALSLAKDTAGAEAAFAKLAEDASSGYVLLARFQAAAARTKAGDAQGAVALYNAIADSSSAAAVYRDLAVILGAAVELNAGADTQALNQRIAPLMADDNPWRYSARELTAAIALNNGDRAAALGQFKAIADDAGSPRDMKQRAGEMVQALGGTASGAK